MTLPCFLCGRHDAHTNCGGLFCHDCRGLPDDQKRDALARALASQEEVLATCNKALKKEAV